MTVSQSFSATNTDPRSWKLLNTKSNIYMASGNVTNFLNRRHVPYVMVLQILLLSTLVSFHHCSAKDLVSTMTPKV